MEDRDNSTKMFDVQLMVDTAHDNHDAYIDNRWLTMEEIEEIYTEIIEQETPKRDSYVLDDLASIDFYHNYDDTYTLDDHDSTTLTPNEWKDICEWFMQKFEDEQEPEYVNDLHEELETNSVVAMWKTKTHSGGYSNRIHIEIANDDEEFIQFHDFDVSLRQVGGLSYEGDVFVSIEGDSVQEIIDADVDA